MGSAFSQQQYVVAKPPTGRLTLTSGTPVMTAEAAAQTNIYYTPYVGAMVPVYDGTGWRERTFSELTLALAASANWASGSNYDLFIVDDGGTLRLLTGPAWTNDTTRSTAISRLNGLWVNDASMTGRYAASSTMTVGQYRGLYVGTVRMSADGTTTWELGGDASGGDVIRWFLWNCYNRVSVAARTGDTVASWTYASATIRAANGTTNKRAIFVRGLNEDSMSVINTTQSAGQSGVVGAVIGVGLDTTTAFTGGMNFNVNSDASPGTQQWTGFPGIGKHELTPNEKASTAATVTFYGQNSYSQDSFDVVGMF